eukprot:scaffold170769_cov28-Tisochrysis_lutea.AAC.8
MKVEARGHARPHRFPPARKQTPPAMAFELSTPRKKVGLPLSDPAADRGHGALCSIAEDAKGRGLRPNWLPSASTDPPGVAEAEDTLRSLRQASPLRRSHA